MTRINNKTWKYQMYTLHKLLITLPQDNVFAELITLINHITKYCINLKKISFVEKFSRRYNDVLQVSLNDFNISSGIELNHHFLYKFFNLKKLESIYIDSFKVCWDDYRYFMCNAKKYFTNLISVFVESQSIPTHLDINTNTLPQLKDFLIPSGIFSFF